MASAASHGSSAHVIGLPTTKKSAPSDTAREVIAELEKSGVQVKVAQGDVSDKQQLDQVLTDIKNFF